MQKLSMAKAKKPTHGGARPNAGRKEKDGEKKASYSASLLPSDKKKIDKKYKTLSKAIEAEIITKLTTKNKI